MVELYLKYPFVHVSYRELLKIDHLRPGREKAFLIAKMFLNRLDLDVNLFKDVFLSCIEFGYQDILILFLQRNIHLEENKLNEKINSLIGIKEKDKTMEILKDFFKSPSIFRQKYANTKYSLNVNTKNYFKSAWIVGVNDYEHLPKLKEAINDAKAVEQKFKDLKFDVVVSSYDGEIDDIMDDLDSFISTVMEELEKDENKYKCSLAVFYFSGHGVTVSSESLLLPSDFEKKFFVSKKIYQKVLSLSRLKTCFSTLQRRGHSVFFLDACRTCIGVKELNKIKRKLTESKMKRKKEEKGKVRESSEESHTEKNEPEKKDGKVNMRMTRSIGEEEVITTKDNCILCFSTDPKSVAFDSGGDSEKNSPYTRSLIKNFNMHGNITDILRGVRTMCLKYSKGNQTPWINSSISVPLFWNVNDFEVDKLSNKFRVGKRVEGIVAVSDEQQSKKEKVDFSKYNLVVKENESLKKEIEMLKDMLNKSYLNVSAHSRSVNTEKRVVVKQPISNSCLGNVVEFVKSSKTFFMILTMSKSTLNYFNSDHGSVHVRNVIFAVIPQTVQFLTNDLKCFKYVKRLMICPFVYSDRENEVLADDSEEDFYDEFSDLIFSFLSFFNLNELIVDRVFGHYCTELSLKKGKKIKSITSICSDFGLGEFLGVTDKVKVGYLPRVVSLDENWLVLQKEFKLFSAVNTLKFKISSAESRKILPYLKFQRVPKFVKLVENGKKGEDIDRLILLGNNASVEHFVNPCMKNKVKVCGVIMKNVGNKLKNWTQGQYLKVKELCLCNVSITNNSLVFIEWFKNLEVLEISSLKDLKSTFKESQFVSSNNKITHLIVRKSDFHRSLFCDTVTHVLLDDVGIKMINENLHKFKKLKEINIKNCKNAKSENEFLSGQMIKSLPESVTKFVASDSAFDVFSLSHLKRMKNMEYFSMTNIDTFNVSFIDSFKELKDLKLVNCTSIDHKVVFKGLKKLRNVTIKNCGVRKKDTFSDDSFSDCSSIETINLSSLEGMKGAIVFSSRENLNDITLKDVPVTDTYLSTLPNVTRMTVYNCKGVKFGFTKHLLALETLEIRVPLDFVVNSMENIEGKNLRKIIFLNQKKAHFVKINEKAIPSMQKFQFQPYHASTNLELMKKKFPFLEFVTWNRQKKKFLSVDEKDKYDQITKEVLHFFEFFGGFLDHVYPICTKETCKTMRVDKEFEYLWRSDTQDAKTPTEIPAYEYITYAMCWIENKILNPKIFPEKNMKKHHYPNNFRNVLERILNFFSMIFDHIQKEHISHLSKSGVEKTLNDNFVRFSKIKIMLNSVSLISKSKGKLTVESGSKDPKISNVALPKGESLNDWLADHTTLFIEKIMLIYGRIRHEGICTKESCPKMIAGPEYEYLWVEPPSKKRPISLPAPEYVDNLMSWIDKKIDDPKIFPIDPPYPKDFFMVVKQIFKRLFRIYAHLYYEHHNYFEDHELTRLNTCFKHFVSFVVEFKLVRERELAPLKEVIKILVGPDALSGVRKKKRKRRNRRGGKK